MDNCVVYRVDWRVNENDEETFELVFYSFEKMKAFADEIISDPNKKLVCTSVFVRKGFMSSSETIMKGYNPEWEYIYGSQD